MIMSKLVKLSKKELAKQIPPHITEGSNFIDGEGYLYTVSKIEKSGKIFLESDEHYKREFSNYEALSEKMNFLDKSPDEMEKELLKDLANNFADYKPNEDEHSTDLVLTSGKDFALEAQRHLATVTERLEVMSSLMNRKKNQLANIKEGFMKKLRDVTRVIGIIELYLGVHADITQIREGAPAPEGTPISFRQLVLHLDEEVAGDLDHEDEQGFDFSDLPVFDKWMKKNIDKILPEKKGVVIARPRRWDKDYGSDNPFAEIEENEKNKMTYVIIRNGMNLYRIRTPDLNIYPHLFPTEKEMKMLTGETKSEDWWRHNEEDNKEKMLGYKRNVLFLQGLIDRTDVFKPHSSGLNLLKPETYHDEIKFIYDADGLTDGRKGFNTWLMEVNSTLRRGDRIYFTGFPWNLFSESSGGGKHEENRRFPVKCGWAKPPAGIYNIKRIENWGEKVYEQALVCHFKATGEIYDPNLKDYRDRKNSIPFNVFRDDDFIINYENVKIEDIEFFIKDRLNRKYYASMMPVLKGIRKMILAEKEQEYGFIELIGSQVDNSTEEILEAIEWWKRRVIEKRPLVREDAKAVRMIKQYLKKGDTGEAVE
jgi:hypothetical protein